MVATCYAENKTRCSHKELSRGLAAGLAKTLPGHAGDTGSSVRKIPCATEQLSPRGTTTELVLQNPGASPLRPCSATREAEQRSQALQPERSPQSSEDPARGQ